MKIKFLIFTFLLFFGSSPVRVNGQSVEFIPSSQEYVIDNFKSEILLNQDLSLTVKEKIDANFNVPKHGILRQIPVTYTNKGKTINSRLKVKSVTDEQGNPVPYKVDRNSKNITLKIGNPNKVIQGKYTYIIEYDVFNVVLLYDEQPEIFWNVTGNDWDTVIKNTEVKVISSYADTVESVCFTGYEGDTSSDCDIKKYGDGIEIQSDPLSSGEGLTIAVRMSENNTLNYPGFIDKTYTSLIDNWGYLVAIIPFSAIFYFWYKKGRDESFSDEKYFYKPEDKKTKTVPFFKRKYLPLVYSPINGLTPGEVGVIIDQRIDIHDVISEIVELARLKYITIEKIKKDSLFNKGEYLFRKLDKDTNKLKEFQMLILNSIFDKSVTVESIKSYDKISDTLNFKGLKGEVNNGKASLLSGLKNHFYKDLPKIKESMYKSLIDQGVFNTSPEKVKGIWIGIFIVLNLSLGLLVIIFSNLYYNFGPILIQGLFFIPGLIFAISMPKRAAWGYSLYRQSMGLRDYLKVGKWRHDINEKHLFFEEILPLAISLGVIDKLAGDMKDIGIAPPQYFKGTSTGGFAADLRGFNSLAAAYAVSSPKSSGSGGSWSGGSGFSGGSSGGGFGGGGGGSW